MLTSPEYNVSVNRYRVSCGSTLENWNLKIGLNTKIHMGGLNGIVIFFRDEEHQMTLVRLPDGIIWTKWKIS